MKILILEDRGSVACYMAEALKGLGYVVSVAYNINEATAIWKHGTFDVIIADLNLSPFGLNDKENLQTQGGRLTGWIWLKEYVLKDNPSMRDKIIVYSEYIVDLLESTSASAEDLQDIKFVSKSGARSSADQIISSLEEINSSLKEA